MKSLLHLEVKPKECSKIRGLIHKMAGNLLIIEARQMDKIEKQKKNTNVSSYLGITQYPNLVSNKDTKNLIVTARVQICLLYTSPSPRD